MDMDILGKNDLSSRLNLIYFALNIYEIVWYLFLLWLSTWKVLEAAPEIWFFTYF